VVRDRSSGDSGSAKQTRFTEMIAVQIYRIAFLIMKFLCSQAKEAVKRAEELEFVDLAHFPELPMPDILHGLQVTIFSIFLKNRYLLILLLALIIQIKNVVLIYKVCFVSNLAQSCIRYI
jgi:hypothetical protein